MGQYDNEARTAARWYVDRLRKRDHLKDVDPKRAGLVIGNAGIAFDPEKVNEFERLLIERLELLLGKSRGRLNIVADYNPPELLLEVGEAVGLDLSYGGIPIKSVMSISPDSVAISPGDGKQFEDLLLIEG